MIIWPLKIKDRKDFHIPEECWQKSRTEEVFIEDENDGEMWQVIDCTGAE